MVADETNNLQKDVNQLASTASHDHVINAIKALLNGVPVVGGAFASLVSDYIPTRRAERMRKFTEDVVKELSNITNSLKTDYVLTDEFSFLFMRTYENISRDYQTAKLEAFKNILVNSLRLDVPSSIQESYLNRVENLTPIHMEVLSVFVSDKRNEALLGPISNHTTSSLHNTIQRLLPTVPSSLIQPIIFDLDMQGITNDVHRALKVTMTGRGAIELADRLTQYGKEFLRFVMAEAK